MFEFVYYLLLFAGKYVKRSESQSLKKNTDMIKYNGQLCNWKKDKKKKNHNNKNQDDKYIESRIEENKTKKYRLNTLIIK